MTDTRIKPGDQVIARYIDGNVEIVRIVYLPQAPGDFFHFDTDGGYKMVNPSVVGSLDKVPEWKLNELKYELARRSRC